MPEVPRKPAEPDDPTVLVGVGLPGDPELMAECVVDEYVRLGLGDEALLRLFRNPAFTAAHAIWRRHGEAYVRALIARARQRWGRPRFTVREPRPTPCGPGRPTGGVGAPPERDDAAGL